MHPDNNNKNNAHMWLSYYSSLKYTDAADNNMCLVSYIILTVAYCFVYFIQPRRIIRKNFLNCSLNELNPLFYNDDPVIILEMLVMGDHIGRIVQNQCNLSYY